MPGVCPTHSGGAPEPLRAQWEGCGATVGPRADATEPAPLLYSPVRLSTAAGIVYRPLTEPVTWAAGAASEECVMGNLDMAETPVPNGMLITDGKVPATIDH